ncbi:MAG: histidine kinase, partial [Eudoraea sp.]|nr:histidine kinase [Eudoraea sp.]
MQLSDKRRNRIFWLLQFLGWGAINMLGILLLKDLSTRFFLYNIIVGIFIGVFTTSILRYYLKRHVFFDNFGIKEIARIFVSTLITGFAYGLLSLAFGFLYKLIGNLETDMDL